MSTYVCEVHGTTVPGALDSVYLTLLDMDDRYKRKLRLCRQHVLELLERRQDEWLVVNPIYGRQLSSACHKCGTYLDKGVANCKFFADVYCKGDEQVKYAAVYCLPCSAAIMHNLDMERDVRPHLRNSVARQVVHDGRYDHSQQPEGSGLGRLRLLNQDDHEASDDHREFENEPGKGKENGVIEPR